MSNGIVFVLRSGIPWEMLPQEMGCGSGMSCWRRLRDWQERGIWQLLHFVATQSARRKRQQIRAHPKDKNAS
jgi:transposase